MLIMLDFKLAQRTDGQANEQTDNTNSRVASRLKRLIYLIENDGHENVIKLSNIDIVSKLARSVIPLALVMFKMMEGIKYDVWK